MAGAVGRQGSCLPKGGQGILSHEEEWVPQRGGSLKYAFDLHPNLGGNSGTVGTGGSLRGLEESNSGNGEVIKQRDLHLPHEEAESSTPERMEFW